MAADNGQEYVGKLVPQHEVVWMVVVTEIKDRRKNEVKEQRYDDKEAEGAHHVDADLALGEIACLQGVSQQGVDATE